MTTPDGQPFFQQPAKIEPPAAIPMTPLGLEIATRVKETFYAYNNRKADDNRTAQVHLGPSEIGTPCDRRLAMALMGRPHVNPGGDGWAAWVGTQGHLGMATIYEWANADSGRYAVEMPLTFPSLLVPKGTGDLLDRVLAVFIDHKFMGKWSLAKLRTEGPSATYRTQVHTYAYGAKQRGEKVKHVAIIGFPREGASLDDLYVWTEPYDRSVAVSALARVEKLSNVVATGVPIDRFPMAPDCSWCPYHLSGSTSPEYGCKGMK